jgi:hypothetical protein
LDKRDKGACEIVGWICRLYVRSWARIKSAATVFVVILLHVLFRHDGISVHAVDSLLALLMSLFPLSKLQQVFRLDLEQAAFDGSGSAQHQFSFDAVRASYSAVEIESRLSLRLRVTRAARSNWRGLTAPGRWRYCLVIPT